MQTQQIPQVLAQPFAAQGDKNTIPNAATGTNKASLQEGFPAITQQPINKGGVPPERGDFNGLGNLCTQFGFAFQNGLAPTFRQEVSDAIGGYAKGALLWYFDEDKKVYIPLTSLVENNTYNFNTNPEYIGTYWGKASEVPDNIYTQSNLLGGKDIEIANEPVEGGVDDNTLLCLHLDGSLDDSAAYGGTAAQATEDSSHTAVSYGPGKFGQAISSNYNYFSYTDNKFTEAFADGKLTVDFWQKLPSKTSNAFLCYGKAGTANKFIVGATRYKANDGTVQIFINAGGTNVAWQELIDAPTFVENEFNHFAFVLNASKATVYINGTKAYQTDITGNLSGITSLDFETGQKNAGGSTASVDEVRVSNIERWTANFVPPTEPYSTATPTGNKVINWAPGDGIDYVVESKLPTAEDPTWYRKYKSGWVEQGGWITSGSSNQTTVTLLVPYQDSNYSVIGSCCSATGSGGNPNKVAFNNRATATFGATTGFGAEGQSFQPFMWEAKGQGAE